MNNKIKNLKLINISGIIGLVVFTFAYIITFAGTAYASEINFDNVGNLINQERSKRDLPKLKINQELNNAAALKSKDMINRNYFEHYAYGLSPWDFVKMAGYNYLYAGENLAMDFNTAEGMVGAWINSDAHRNNILNPDYIEMGVGIVKGEFTENSTNHETIMITNMFGREKPAIIKAFDYLAQSILNLF